MQLRGVVTCLVVVGCYRGTSSLAPCTVQGLPGEGCAGDGGAGDGGTTPSCVTQIAPGRWHACVLRNDSTVWCAGASSNGQLGNGSGGMSATFVQIPGITDATAIGAGWSHTCAVRAGGAVWCWGSNGNGELGASGGPEPVQVGDASGSMLANAVEVAAGYGFTCARIDDGTIKCWGRGVEGQLGDNFYTSRMSAGTVSGLPAAAALAAGRNHVCILGTDGTMWCWGENGSGQVGDGNSGQGVTRGSPFQIPLAMSAKQIATGTFHTCAVLADTSVQCWGGNWQQAIGVANNGANVAQPTAVQAEGGGGYAGAASIAAGGAVSFAIGPDGHVDSWGDSVHGQAGNAGGVHPTPIPIDSVSRIVAHFAHTCAVDTDGRFECWGRNTEGELGNGTFANVALPQPLASVCP